MAKRYRVTSTPPGISLRQSPDKRSPKYNEWHDWATGEVFTPPKHMNVKRALERGIIEEVGDVRTTTEERPADAEPGEIVGGFLEEVSDDGED